MTSTLVVQASLAIVAIAPFARSPRHSAYFVATTMPFLHVSSNVTAAGIDSDAAARALSKSLAEALGAPEKLLLVKLSLDEKMLFAKTSDVRTSYALCTRAYR